MICLLINAQLNINNGFVIKTNIQNVIENERTNL